MPRPADPQRRDTILRAARTVFLEHGYTGARMAEIAQRAEIAVGTLYLYFPSKEALVAALADDFHRRFVEVLHPALAYPDAAEAIVQAVHAALQFAAEERDLLGLLHLTVGVHLLRSSAAHTLYKTVVTALTEKMEQGQIRRYEPLVLADLITSLFQRASEVCILHTEGDLLRYEETIIQLLQYALLPAPRSAQ